MNECLLGFFFILLTISCKKFFVLFFFPVLWKIGRKLEENSQVFSYVKMIS